MSDQHLKPQWYEISIGWTDVKSWFLVDRMQPDIKPILDPWNTWKPRESSVSVKTTNDAIGEITIQATFPYMPTIEDALEYVLKVTHNDHSPEVRFHLTSRKEGLHSAAKPLHEDLERELDRLRNCVSADGLDRYDGVS
ncbi:MAG: hypothetical protein K5924_12620 [Chloroflexi bacterium]|nr:hypothetical protein [Chloroflexota bacterium]